MIMIVTRHHKGSALPFHGRKAWYRRLLCYETSVLGDRKWGHFHNRNSSSYDNYYGYWNSLQKNIDSVSSKTLYSGSIYASMSFNEPYPRAIDFEVLTLAFIQLLEQYALNIESDYVQFTIGYSMQLPLNSDVSVTLGKAIPLCDKLGNRVPRSTVYDKIEQQVMLYGEQYQDALIQAVFLRIYYEPKDSLKQKSIDHPNINDMFRLIINVMDSKIEGVDLPDVKSLQTVMSRIPNKINTLKRSSLKCRSFIVADLETILVDNVHVPYAAGY